MLTTLMCVISVMVCGNEKCTLGIQSSPTEIEGKLIGSGDTKYLVDFSKAAKEYNWMGDYSRKLVNKTDCVKLK